MRIAVLLYGRINRYKELYIRFRKFFGANDIDIFYSSDATQEEDLQEFIRIYKPVSWCNDKIEASDIFTKLANKYRKEEKNYTNNNPYTRMYCHFINKKRVFDLLDIYIHNTGSVYDLIVTTRLDLYYLVPLPTIELKEDTIYLPNNHPIPGVNDHIAIGSYNVMKIYHNICSSAEYIIDNITHDLSPHLTTYVNLIIHEVKIKLINCPYHLVTEVGVLKPKGWIQDLPLPLP